MSQHAQVASGLNVHADQSSNQIQTFICFMMLLNDTSGFGRKYCFTWENNAHTG
jgi:hypothetical protein